MEACPCGAPRYQPLRQPLSNHNYNGPRPRPRTLIRKPRKTFFYFPIIPRLRLQYANADRSKLMQDYVSNQPVYVETDLIGDFWSGKLYEDLKIGGYFEDQRTIALTFTGDGMNLTRQRNYTCFVCKYYYSFVSLYTSKFSMAHAEMWRNENISIE